MNPTSYSRSECEGVHERSELQIFQLESVKACVRKKFGVGFRGGFSLYLSFCNRKRKKAVSASQKPY